MSKRSIIKCRACGANIVFMYTAEKKMIPVDYKPEIENEDQFDSKKMVSHFATCTKAGDFRKGKKK